MTSGPMPSPARTAIWKPSSTVMQCFHCSWIGALFKAIIRPRWAYETGQENEIRMPRFAANLAYLFTERGMLERFAAASAAGFTAVELQLPYDHAPSAVKAELDRHGLTMLGLNTAPGQTAAGEFGVAAVPGREREFATLFKQALDYVTAIGGCQIHCLAGKVPPEQRPAAEMTFIRNLARIADAAREKNITVLIEPINARDRPDYFLTRAEQ